jgi:antitoxin YefM
MYVMTSAPGKGRDRVTEDLDEIIVLRPDRDPAVVISLREYE